MWLDAEHGQERVSFTMLQKIARKDRLAAAECVDKYGDLIWSLARESTDSDAQAETAVRGILRIFGIVPDITVRAKSTNP